MLSQWQYSAVSLLQVVKGNIAGGVISAFIIVCLRVGLGQRNVNAQVILLIIGLLLIAAVALPNIIGNVKKAVSMKKN